jgi:hypothetical protein
MGRAVRTVLLLAFLALIAAVAWVAVRGAQARGHLEDAADGVTTLQRQMSRLEVDAARQTVGEIQQDTAEAHDLTSDPVWDLLGLFPWGGQNLVAVGTATESVDRLARQGLPALVGAGESIDTFRQHLAAGDLDPAPLRQVADDVATLDRSLEGAQADLRGIDRDYLVPAVSRALDELSQSLDAAGSVAAQLDAQLQSGSGG